MFIICNFVRFVRLKMFIYKALKVKANWPCLYFFQIRGLYLQLFWLSFCNRFDYNVDMEFGRYNVAITRNAMQYAIINNNLYSHMITPWRTTQIQIKREKKIKLASLDHVE